MGDITFAFHNSKEWSGTDGGPSISQRLYSFISTACIIKNMTAAPIAGVWEQMHSEKNKNVIGKALGSFWLFQYVGIKNPHQWDYDAGTLCLCIICHRLQTAEALKRNVKAGSQRLMFCWTGNVLSFHWRPELILTGPFSFRLDLSLLAALISWIWLQAQLWTAQLLTLGICKHCWTYSFAAGLLCTSFIPVIRNI